MAFPLTQEQRNIVADRGGELLVSAAAGSGKTRVLVERLLDRVTGEGMDIDRFLVITYTKAAAAELRERIARELTQRLAQDPTDRHLRRQTTLVYQAQISTIHSFCSALLRESGYLLDLDPDMRLCDEIEGKVLMGQTLESVIDSRYEDLQPDSPFAQLVDTLGAGRDDGRLVEIVLDIFSRVQSHADPQRWLLEQRQLWSLEDVKDLTDTPWGKLLLEETTSAAAHCAELLGQFRDTVEGDELLRENYSHSLEETVAALKGLSAAENWDGACRFLPIPFPRVGTKRKRKEEVDEWQALRAAHAAERIKAVRERCKKTMEKAGEAFTGDSALMLEELRLSGPSMQALVDLVLEFQDAFAAEKKRRNLLDFSDLEHFAVKLLCHPDGTPTDLAHSWSRRYEEILVDEYQDTNQVQNAIFLAISEGGRKLVQVGDVKQSIYRFRLADPTIFLEKYHRFRPGHEAGAGEARVRLLSKNFRSRPQVLEGCNDLFRSIMSERLGELEYTEDQALYPGASFPEGDNYALELNILDLARDEEDEPDSTNNPGRDLLEARFAAKRIRGLLDGKFKISEGESLRPVRPSDIMVLLRSPGSVLHHYIRAFVEAGIPWNAEGGGDYFETPEIYAAMSILKIVDNPRQDVPLIAALRCPVYGFCADRLAFLRGESRGDFYSALLSAAEKGEADCVDFLRELEQLRFGAGEKTAGEMIWHIYEQTNLLGIFGAMENGDVRRENLLSLYALARQMEGAGCRTLFQFLLRLDRLNETGGKVRTAASGVEGEGVSIMSIHRSKGLEKPVVLLCGLTKKMNKQDLARPVLFHPVLGIGPKGLDTRRRVEYSTVARRAVSRALDREMMSEELRLLYVAMTRAREKLILTLALKDGEKTLSDLVEMAAEKPAPEVLMQQGSVGHWILLHALTRAEAKTLDQVMLLGQRREEIDYPYPWDFKWRRGEDYVSVPRRLRTKPDADPEMENEQLSRRLRAMAWKYPVPAPANIPSKLTATQLKGRVLDSEIAEDTPVKEEAGKPIYRPDFIVRERGLTPAQRGTALHLVMEQLPLDGDLSEQGVRRFVERLVREDFLTPQQGEAIPVGQVARFYQSDLGQKLAKAATVRREFKFSLLVDAGEYFPEAPGEQLLLQGVVDLWFEDEDGITVVDFKSDHVLPGEEIYRAQEYRPQLAAYSRALKTILGAQKLKTVLWFFATGTAVEL